MKKKNVIVFIMVFGLLTASMLIFLSFHKAVTDYVFETDKVERGSVNITITATGTLEATNTVVVGTQVSGVIEKLHVDFNSIVKKGQLIAELDKSTLLSSLENAEADVSKALAEFEYQESNQARMKTLYDQDMLAASDFDLAEYNYKISKASLKSARANLDKAKRNLSYAMIYSPIDGVVLNRAVEEGQTVAASMSTPELFTITNDLSEMQVEADVDEADIGMVKLEQPVDFTVDAFPDETFSGEVTEVRLQPTVSSNVVTYTVIVTVENPKQKLKPGMTASIIDYVEEANDVLLMSGKAIRFQPERELMQDYRSSLPEDKQSHQGPPPGEETDETHQRIWIKEGSAIKPVLVETGINDGSQIEILSGLAEGDLVLTSMEKVTGRSGEENNHDEEEQSSPFVQERGGGGGPPRR